MYTCSLSTSTPTIEQSSSETILTQPIPQSPFRVLDTNTRKICGDVVLPENGNTNPSHIVGYILGIDAKNYKSDDALNLFVFFTLSSNTIAKEPTSLSRFYIGLCASSYLPPCITKSMCTANTTWTRNWNESTKWCHEPTQSIKVEPNTTHENFYTIVDGPNPLKQCVCDKELLKSLNPCVQHLI